MLIQSTPASHRADTTHHKAPAEQQVARESASKSSAVTLDLSESAIARATEAMRAAAERQASQAAGAAVAAAPAESPPVPEPPTRASRPSPPRRVTPADVLDPERIHREELKALLSTHTGANLYVIRSTLEELAGESPRDPAEEAHEIEARARREALRVVRSEVIASPPRPAEVERPSAVFEVPPEAAPTDE